MRSSHSRHLKCALVGVVRKLDGNPANVSHYLCVLAVLAAFSYSPSVLSPCVLPVSHADLDEKYIVLIFENGLSMHEQMILEEILVEIGRTNGLQEFPAKLTFAEANVRLVQYNKAAKEKEKVKVALISLGCKQLSNIFTPGQSHLPEFTALEEKLGE